MRLIYGSIGLESTCKSWSICFAVGRKNPQGKSGQSIGPVRFSRGVIGEEGPRNFPLSGSALESDGVCKADQNNRVIVGQFL